MPHLIDSKHRTPNWNRRLLILSAVILLALIFSATTLLAAWVDLQWFTSLNYASVFWKMLTLQAGVFVSIAALTFAILFTAFTTLRRTHSADLPAAQSIMFGGQTFNLSVEPVLRVLSLAVSILVALISGASIMSDWPQLALFWYAPKVAGQLTDPTFAKPLNFYLFTLPAWNLLNDWLLTLALAICAAAAVYFVITSSTRALDKRTTGVTNGSPWRGISIALSFLLLVVASMVYVSRYELLLDHHTIFDGLNYTDAHITIYGLLIVSLALIAGAFIAAFNALRIPRGRLLAASIAPAAFCYIVLGLIGWYVGNFIVKPNELVREEPYITNNITGTRAAFGLDRFHQQEFPAETTIEAADPANNQPTLQNIRLWDWHALQDTLRQVQEIRTYYDFPDIDIDRYNVNGTTREVMLAARELNIDKLPVSSRNWINERLTYTHGYGVTMNPVNGFTPEGLPLFLLSNMPVQATSANINVTRPEIYFGELTNSDVYVKTHQQEFDYPQGQGNNFTSYQGTGGILLGGFLRRILLAFDRGDIGKLPFSDDVTPDSRLLMRRNIRERVAALAPFLTFDQDPYLVVGDDGKLSWILDAYTTADTYPYSTHYSLGDNPVNYIRNSVKVVIDAYNGAATFYVFDPADPIINAYRGIFPTLFRDASSMPADLRRHVRYPEDIFTLQSQVYGLYHMTNPEVFFNREDLWTVATENGTDADGNQAVLPMKPNFVLMKLPSVASEPNANREEFVEILPFTPANRNNLIGWIAGRCDGPDYGSAVVYDFPKTRLVDGPQQIEARIDQNAQLSGQLTLWNQQGSHVLRGSLLVIPTGKALLYAEPIYLQAQQSPMPELRLVVLALQDKLAYGPTFQAALTSLFGGESSSLTSTEPAAQPNQPAPAPGSPNTPTPPAANQPAATTASLIASASQDFADYQRLTAAGKLSEAGQKLDALKHTLDQLNAHSK